MGVNTTHDAHVKRWGQRYVAKSPFVALFYRNRFFEAAPDPHRATRGWIEDRKTKWNPMVPTTQQTRYCNQYMLSICIKLYNIYIYTYLFICTYGIICACCGSCVPKPWTHCCRWGLPVWLWSLNMCFAHLGQSWRRPRSPLQRSL